MPGEAAYPLAVSPGNLPPKILAHVHKYPPAHNAGAEWYLHTVLKHMQSHGAEVRVMVRDGFGEPSFEGVPLMPHYQLNHHYRWADLVITHLDLTGQVMARARQLEKPIVHLVHNDRQLAFHHVFPETAQLVVFNSKWIARKVAWQGPQMVLPPPVIAGHYATRPGDHLTLVGMSKAKGAEMFFSLASRLPDERFLGVLGAYGLQITPEHCPNVTYVENGPDMRAVYSKTRILLMPSSYESWGRVAIEAAASGIPTIASPTPGLTESLGTAGIFAPLDDISAWEAQIARLSAPEAYRAASDAALARSAELDPTEGLERLRAALWGLRAL